MIPDKPVFTDGGLRLPAELERLPAFLAYVRRMAETAGLSPAQASRLELAVEEALVNVCGHAYVGQPQAGMVFCRVAIRSEGLTVSIVDEGLPFDPLTQPDPERVLDLDQREPGGLGILLIKSLASEVTYRREGDRNVLMIEIRK
ncbi:MAG: ATP-binding protein [Candidatus Competibacter sp.]